jgi:hypothetical protein
MKGRKGLALRLRQLNRRYGFGIGVLLSAFGAALPARANGAFPSASQLLVDPASTDRLMLRATFGVLTTADRGSSWSWLCEGGMGYVDLEPPMAVLPGGTILLALPNGVSVSDAQNCDFRLASGIDANVLDLSRVPAEPKSAIAVSVSGTVSQVWQSLDGGLSFSTLGDPLDGFIAATLDAGATDPNVIYLSGIQGTAGVLLRSGDRGKSYESYPVPHTTTGRRPYIAAVDPKDANTVYVRLIGVQGELEVTRDGGKSFTTILQTTVPVQGFALSPDGKTVLASNTFDGTYRASTSDYAFEKIACDGHACLSWSEAGLFGCGDDKVDGFIVGRSEDEGATFERAVDLSCIGGPLACDGTTSIGAECPTAWPAVQTQLGATECMPHDVAPYTGCFAGGAGAGDTGGTSTAGGTANGGATATGGSAGGGTTANGGSSGDGAPRGGGSRAKSGGGCRVGGPAAPRGGLGFVVAMAWLFRARRRRARPEAEG